MTGAVSEHRDGSGPLGIESLPSLVATRRIFAATVYLEVDAKLVRRTPRTESERALMVLPWGGIALPQEKLLSLPLGGSKMPMAYMFWHSPAVAGEEASGYESRHQAFHRALAELAPEGLLSIRMLRFERVTWLPSAAPIYEDTYVLSGFAALDALETAAVSPPLLEVHNAVARRVGSATAGLYKLHSGQWQSKPPLWAQWFSKPAGESYDQLRQRFDGIPAGEFELWGRQLVLGPTKEFCIRAHRPLELADLQAEETCMATSHWAFGVGNRDAGI